MQLIRSALWVRNYNDGNRFDSHSVSNDGSRVGYSLSLTIFKGKYVFVNNEDNCMARVSRSIVEWVRRSNSVLALDSLGSVSRPLGYSAED